MPETNNTATLSERVRSLRLSDRPTTTGPTWFPWVLCGVLLVGCVFFALEAMAPIPDEVLKQIAAEKGGGPVEAKGGEAPRALPAATGSPSESGGGGGDIVLESKGYVVPVHTIQVSPLIGGRVMALNFEEGMLVKEGFVLAQIEDVEYARDHDRLKAMEEMAGARIGVLSKFLPKEVEQLDAEMKDAIAQRDLFYSEYKRSTDLKGSRSLSTREYEQAESSYRSQEQKVRRLQLAIELMQSGTRQEQIRAAQAELKQYQAEAAKAKWKLDNTIVKAPITGTILSKKAEKGNMVNPAAFSNGLSASLCEMADLADMEVDLSIAERDIGKLFAGQACKVRAEAFPDRNYTARISRIMPQADRAKGAVPVRVKIDIPADEAGRFLRPEMGALVTFYNKK